MDSSNDTHTLELIQDIVLELAPAELIESFHLCLVDGGDVQPTQSFYSSQSDTVCEWASCSKPLTAAILMMLRDQGKLEDLDESIFDYLCHRQSRSVPAAA